MTTEDPDPASATPALTPARVPISAPFNIPRRILIADDHHANRDLLQRMLQQFTDAEVEVASDGAEAIALYADSRPEISMLDIDMPVMDGFALLEQIRNINPGAFVVMVSGHSDADAVQKALKLGVGGYIVKPYSAQRVLDALKRYLKETGDTRMLRVRA